MKTKIITRVISGGLVALTVLSLVACSDNSSPEIESIIAESPFEVESAVVSTEFTTSQTENQISVVVENTEPLVSIDSFENEPNSNKSADDSLTEKTEPLENSAVSTSVVTAPTTAKPVDVYIDTSEDELTSTQRNSINMLNYMTVMTQRINQSAKNQAFLESAYSALENDLYPNAVDSRTQAQSTNLLDTINNYRMISVKWNRLEYIYEQNRAQALRQAIPNPMGLLSAVQSGNMLKAAASVIYMAVDAKASYDSATSQADLQFVKDGWELEDAESSELHNSTKNALNYMYNIVRDYDIPGDYALNRESVESFVTWAGKPNLVSKIAWFESNEKTYSQFGPYWLELAKDYYDNREYGKCLEATTRYEAISTRIFRKDLDYARTLPMVIISAREEFEESEYIEFADKYCSRILANTKDSDWSIQYFTAQIYLDLYSKTHDVKYAESAYEIAFDNVNILADNQRTFNNAYLAPVKEEKTEKSATKREKAEVKDYNKLLKEERKVALPPVNEALYLNCDLLFALAEELNKPEKELIRIESILHENGDPIFLTNALDNRFWFTNSPELPTADDITITFTGNELVIPAVCISDRSSIIVEVNSTDGNTLISDWVVKDVVRPKNAGVSEFTVKYESKEGKNHKFKAGDTLFITVVPVQETPDYAIVFEYDVIATKKAFVFNGISFERKMK